MSEEEKRSGNFLTTGPRAFTSVSYKKEQIVILVDQWKLLGLLLLKLDVVELMC